MSLSTILSQIGATESDFADIPNDTPLRGMGVPKRKQEYAIAFHKMLEAMETTVPYSKDTYSEIDTLNTDYRNNYDDSTFATGPKENDASTQTLYLIGAAADPIDFIDRIAQKAAESSNKDYVQLPVYKTVEDAKNEDMPFGALVAVEETQDAYLETDTS